MTLAECGLDNGSSLYIESDEKKIISYSFSRYTKAPQTGLKKIGENSPFNSILQMLASVKNIASFFINPNNDEKFLSSGTFTKAMRNLFLNLYPFPEKDQREIYEPKEQFLSLIHI